MKKIIVSLFFSTLFAYAQTTELTGWQINDVKLSSKFLQAYLDTLENYENLFSDNDPQLDDILIIRIEIGRDEDIKLSDIKSKSIGSRTYSRMIDTLIQKLDKKLIDELISRRYSWTELNKDELLQIGIRQDVKNIFQERSAKTTRDAFWWTNREFDLSSNLRFVIRPYKSTWGFIVEQGLSNIGYDVLSSRSISMGVVNEITKVSLIAPWKLPYESALLMGRPLDGFWGFNLGFETQYIGGEIFFQDPGMGYDSFESYDQEKNNFITVPFSGNLYYSNSFTLQERNKYIESGNRFGPSKKQLFPSGNLSIKAGVSYRMLAYGNIIDDKINFLDRTELLESIRFLFDLGYITDNDGFSLNTKIFFGNQTSFTLALDRRFVNSAEFLKIGFRLNWSNEVVFNEDSESNFKWNPKLVFMPTFTVIF